MSFLFSYSATQLHTIFTVLVEEYDKIDHRSVGKALTDKLHRLISRSSPIVDSSGWSQANCPEAVTAIKQCFTTLPITLDRTAAISLCTQSVNFLPAKFISALSNIEASTDECVTACACLALLARQLKQLRNSGYSGETDKIQFVNYLLEALNAVEPCYIPSWPEVRDAIHERLTAYSTTAPKENRQIRTTLAKLISQFANIDTASYNDTEKTIAAANAILTFKVYEYSSSPTLYAAPPIALGTLESYKKGLIDIIAPRRLDMFAYADSKLAAGIHETASQFADEKEKTVHTPAKDWSELLETPKPPDSSSTADAASPSTGFINGHTKSYGAM